MSVYQLLTRMSRGLIILTVWTQF